MSSQLAIVGALPPPFGGVTTHLDRLCRQLDLRRVDYTFYDMAGGKEPRGRVKRIAHFKRLWLLWFALSCREQAIYLVSQRVGVWLVGALIARFRKRRVIIRLPNMNIVKQARQHGFSRCLTDLSLDFFAYRYC